MSFDRVFSGWTSVPRCKAKTRERPEREPQMGEPRDGGLEVEWRVKRHGFVPFFSGFAFDVTWKDPKTTDEGLERTNWCEAESVFF